MVYGFVFNVYKKQMGLKVKVKFNEERTADKPS